MYLPKFHGPICLTPDNIRKIESSIHNTRGKTGAVIFRIGIGIERVEGLRLCDLINDMPDEELKDFEEKMLAALLDLHNDFEICHKDIKADNILLPRSLSSRSTGFVVIDLSEAIIRKYTLDEVWKKACKDDLQALREIFMDARSAKVGARNSLTSLTPTLTYVIIIGRHSRLPAYSKGNIYPPTLGHERCRNFQSLKQ